MIFGPSTWCTRLAKSFFSVSMEISFLRESQLQYSVVAASPRSYYWLKAMWMYLLVTSCGSVFSFLRLEATDLTVPFFAEGAGAWILRISSCLRFFYFSCSSSTSRSSSGGYSLLWSDSVWLKSLSNSSLPELLSTQSSSSLSPSSRSPKNWLPCCAQKESSSSSFLRLMRQFILVPRFSRNCMLRMAMFSGFTEEMDDSESSSSSSWEPELPLPSLSDCSAESRSESRSSCGERSWSESSSSQNCSSSGWRFFLMTRVLVLREATSLMILFPIYNSYKRQHLYIITELQSTSTITAAPPSPDDLVPAEELLDLDAAHLDHVLLEEDHEEQAAESDLVLLDLPVLVFLLGVAVHIFEDAKLLLLLLEVVIAEVGAEVVLHVAPADHRHQLQDVLVLHALAVVDVLLPLPVQAILHELPHLVLHLVGLLEFAFDHVLLQLVLEEGHRQPVRPRLGFV